MISREEILKGNTLICEFMGGLVTTTGHVRGYRKMKLPLSSNYDFDTLKVGGFDYPYSFDWLMPVLEKICRLKIGNGIQTVNYAYPRTFGMMDLETKQLMVRLDGFQLHHANTLIEATYMAIIEFIEHYNSKILNKKP